MSSIEKNSLFKKGAYGFIISLIILIFSFFYIDQPLASWITSHQLQDSRIALWLTYIPNAFIYFSAMILFGLFLRTNQLNKKFVHTILAICISCYVTFALTKCLKFFFGRIGPEYWVSKNFDPTAYGFYLFQGGTRIFQDFPSGHSAISFAVISVIWLLYPGIRWFCILCSITIVASLLITNSHYFGDCIAGAFLGTLVGVLSIKFLELNFFTKK